MSDLLAIVDLDSSDDELVAEILRRHADRVTLLIESEWDSVDTARGRALRDRLTALRAIIEARTGAVVVGLANSREQLLGWRFDRIVGGARQTAPVPA